MESIPKYIVHIRYGGETLRKKQKKDPGLSEAGKFLYIYEEENLDRVMMRAWKKDCRATIHSISVTSSKEFKPSQVTGIWE